MMPTASCLIRDQPHYRRVAFAMGLTRAGYNVTFRTNPIPRFGDVLVIWNRYQHWAAEADRYEAVGADVIVAENAYLDPRSDPPAFALSHGQHNGAGWWPSDDGDRWTRLGIDLEPWRLRGDELVVLPQRGIGPPGVAMPRLWEDDVVSRLRMVSKRPVRVRRHPGTVKTDPIPDLANAWAVITWGSTAALKAIVAGVPAFYEMPGWIGAGAALMGLSEIERPFLGDRLPMLRRMAWAQWSVKEIETGYPFLRLTRR